MMVKAFHIYLRIGYQDKQKSYLKITNPYLSFFYNFFYGIKQNLGGLYHCCIPGCKFSMYFY
jgi:hypothetical protein